MIIRQANALDAQSVGEIRVAAWKQAYQDFMPAEFLASLDPAASLDRMRVALSAQPPPFFMTVAVVGQTAVAFSMLGKPRYRAAKSVAELWALNVHPAHWHQGIGRRLVCAALADAQRQGYTQLELWCINGNQAAGQLYEACGFTRTGQHRTTTNLTGSPLHELAYQIAL